MHFSVQNITLLKSEIKKNYSQKKLKNIEPIIVAVSKTFTSNDILPLIKHGHVHFGENKVQEAENKWPNLLKEFTNLKLHMIGKLQSNKVKKAVQLFDYIHSLENRKLADLIFKSQKELNKNVKLFIQVNIGNEDQKSGVLVKDLKDLYLYCTEKLSLDVIGLMCLPPNDANADKYFDQMRNLSENLKISELSIGMSNDYLNALKYGATYLRLGTAVFGKRKSN